MTLENFNPDDFIIGGISSKGAIPMEALLPARPVKKKIESNGDVESAIRKLVESVTPSQTIDADMVNRLISERLDKLVTPSIEIKTDDREPVKFERAHKKIETLVKLAALRGPNGHHMNLYMHGPAGSGKSTAAHQVSLALGLPYGYASLNPMIPDSRAMGFMNAHGDYVPSEFFKRYTEGGVFCWDEIDNASASFTTTLNSCLENGTGAFPHGVFARHKDFICIATANTIGRGGDLHYPERRALDGAFLDRFYFVEWPQDTLLTESIVRAIVGHDKADELISWVSASGENLKIRHPEIVVSPRAYIQAAILTRDGFSRTEIEHGAIWRGVK